MHPDAERLFALDAALRAEADEVLARSRIGAILEEARYEVVGSYVMRTMTWRDLDFERYEEPDWERHWEVGARLARTGWFWRLNCVNSYREGGNDRPQGLYWGLRLSDPSEADPASNPSAIVWKLDLWTGRIEEFASAMPKRQLWASLMTDEKRSHILAIKEAVWQEPEYRRSMLSVHVYEAVLEEDVRGVEEFREWWRRRHGEGDAR
jgi:hypothetical protein